MAVFLARNLITCIYTYFLTVEKCNNSIKFSLATLEVLGSTLEVLGSTLLTQHLLSNIGFLQKF